MAEKDLTPCGALFDAMKRFGGVSHSETAALILSGRPLADGRSAISRASEDPTWLSRYIVHAPIETIQPQYFATPSLSAMRLIARLKLSKAKGDKSKDILEILESSACPMMMAALERSGQNSQICTNVLARFSATEGLSHSEREEVTMILLVAAAVFGNARRAVDYTLAYSKKAWGAVADCTPLAEALPIAQNEQASPLRPIGLMRVDGGYTTGVPIWIDPEEGSIEIGSMAFGENDIADVGPHVSARHARISCEQSGAWTLEDLESTNGTVLVGGGGGEEVECAPGVPQKLNPGDEIRLAGETRFIVLAG